MLESDARNERMIQSQIVARGVTDPRVLEAMRSVPRDLFVPPQHRSSAFDDTPLPLDQGQTISQPFIVAKMTELLQVEPHHKVLEIGTGSGYQTAILARLAALVCSAEVTPERGVEHRLEQLGIRNVIVRIGDGVQVFRDHAPFDRILSAAAPVEMPEELLDQLAEGGRCVIPVGETEWQSLWLYEKTDGRVRREQLDAVRFVPLRRQPK